VTGVLLPSELSVTAIIAQVFARRGSLGLKSPFGRMVRV
jgi:hypothetical protein